MELKRRWILMLLISLSQAAAWAETAWVGSGYGPQSLLNLDGQYNGVVDVGYVFWESTPERTRWQWHVGAGYTYVFTDADVHDDVHMVSLLPSLRRYLTKRGCMTPFLELTIGPSYMSEKWLGYREQGSHFIFNDFFSVGTLFGEEGEWEIRYSWRHLSNGNLFDPNPGWDIPFSLQIGRLF